MTLLLFKIFIIEPDNGCIMIKTCSTTMQNSTEKPDLKSITSMCRPIIFW